MLPIYVGYRYRRKIFS